MTIKRTPRRCVAFIVEDQHRVAQVFMLLSTVEQRIKKTNLHRTSKPDRPAVRAIAKDDGGLWEALKSMVQKSKITLYDCDTIGSSIILYSFFKHESQP